MGHKKFGDAADLGIGVWLSP